MRSWLIAIRRSCGLKQSSVAKSAQISQATYCLIESGKRRPSPEVAKRIAAVLEFDWTRFYDPDQQKQ